MKRVLLDEELSEDEPERPHEYVIRILEPNAIKEWRKEESSSPVKPGKTFTNFAPKTTKNKAAHIKDMYFGGALMYKPMKKAV